MQKPTWFNIKDLLAWGGSGFLTALALIIILAMGYTIPNNAIALMIVVSLAFWGIWCRVIYLKIKDLNSFSWYPKYALMVEKEKNYHVSQEKIEELTQKTITGWSPHFAQAEDIIKNHVTWVWFDKKLDETSNNAAGMKVNGFAVNRTNRIVVDYDYEDQPLESTAFEHELGHIIQGFATNDWNQKTHHERSKRLGLK